MQQRSVRSCMAAFMIMGTCVAPTLTLVTAPARAQSLFAQGGGNLVASGTEIRVVEPDGKKIVLRPDEEMPVTLVTRQAVRSPQGTVLIRRGAKIEGTFRPYEDGTRFEAQRVELKNGRERRIFAQSETIRDRETIRRGVNAGPIWQGALVGGAAAAIISELVDDVGIFKVLGGAGAGALAGWLIGGRDSAEVIVIDEDRTLKLTLQEDLLIGRRF